MTFTINQVYQMSQSKKPTYFYGYNIVGACFLIQWICIGTTFTYGLFFKEFQVDFGWSRALISGASSLNFLLTGFAGIFAGRLNDRIGPKIVITAAGVLLGIGYLLMSQLNEVWQLYLVYGVLIGVGISAVDVITLSTIARWYVRYRGIISGVVKVGTGSGQLIVPVIIAAFIASIGWRNSYFIIAGSTLLILVGVAQLLRRDPEEMGLLPDGDSIEYRENGVEILEFSVSVKMALRTWQFWIICLVLFFTFFCLISVVVHIFPHARDSGLSSTTSALVLSAIGGVSMFGRIALGLLNDRIGGKRSFIACFFILLCSLVLLQLADVMWMFFLFAAVYGIAHGGFFTVISPIVAEYFGLGSHGVLLGIIYFIGTIGGAIGPSVAGWIFDTTGSYQVAFYLLIIVAGMGLIMITQLRPMQK